MGRALILAAVLCFAFGVFGVSPFGLSPVALGLAFFAAGHLV